MWSTFAPPEKQSELERCSPQSAVRFGFCRRLFIFELNSQSNYTPLFRAPEAPCWLAGIVYGLGQATMFDSHLQSLDEHQIFCWVQTQNWQLEDPEEQFAEFDKKWIGLESQTAPLNLVWPTTAVNEESSIKTQTQENYYFRGWNLILAVTDILLTLLCFSGLLPSMSYILSTFQKYTSTTVDTVKILRYSLV